MMSAVDHVAKAVQPQRCSHSNGATAPQPQQCGHSKGWLCVTTKTRHLDRLGQLSEIEQDSNTGWLCATTKVGCVLQQRLAVCYNKDAVGCVPRALRAWLGSTVACF